MKALKVILADHTGPTGLVRSSEYIQDVVRQLRGSPLDPVEIARTLKISEPKARAKALATMRSNLDKMIGEFVKQDVGAPKLQGLRANAPLEVVINAYEMYQDKCIRASARMNTRAVECGKQLKRLRKRRDAQHT